MISAESTADETTRSIRLSNTAPWFAALVVVVFWIALGNRYSLWIDESYSVEQARLPFGSFLRSVFVTGEGNMSPYYLLLWPWEKLVSGALWARGLSVVGSLLAIWGLWVFLRRRAGTTIAAGAVIIFAVNPFVLKWSIQARGYTFVMAASIWSLVCAESLVRKRDFRSAIFLGLLTGIAAATSLSSIFVLGAIQVVVLVLRPNWLMFRRMCLASACALVAFTPFIWAFSGDRNWTTWMPVLTGELFAEQTLRLLGGGPTAIVFGVTIVGFSIAGLVRRRPPEHLIPVVIALVGLVSLVLVSRLIQPLFMAHYLSATVPMTIVGVVGSLTVLEGRARDIAVGILVATCITVSSFWGNHALPPNERYRDLVAFIEAEAQPGDAVAAYPWWGMHIVENNWDSPPQDLEFVRVADASGSLVDEADPGRSVFPLRVWVVMRGRDAIHDPEGTEYGYLLQRYPQMLVWERWGYLQLLLLGMSGDGAP